MDREREEGKKNGLRNNEKKYIETMEEATLTPCTRDLLEKLTVSQLVKEIPFIL
jgi:hypothetical protein